MKLNTYGLPALHLKQYKTCHSVNSCKTLLKFTLFKTDLNKFTVGTLTILAGRLFQMSMRLQANENCLALLLQNGLQSLNSWPLVTLLLEKTKNHQYLSRQSYE